MNYGLVFTDKAKNDIGAFIKAGNKTVLKKLKVVLEDIIEHPFTGIGKPEQLKHELTGCWSRRINKEHRIIYQVDENIISILSAKGHYE